MEDPEANLLKDLISRYAVGCTLHDMDSTTFHAPIPPLALSVYFYK